MDQQPAGKKREIIAALAVLIVIVAIVAGASILSKKDASDTNTDTTNTSQSTDSNTNNPSAEEDSTSNPAGSYKDGSYNATGSYNSPGGPQKITISVTLANGIVTATSADSGATDAEAEEYQNAFISGYKQLVVGKDIDSISLSRVSGSSLTSQGFNSAIQQIEDQAKV